jgi:hypothetical protein
LSRSPPLSAGEGKPVSSEPTSEHGLVIPGARRHPRPGGRWCAVRSRSTLTGSSSGRADTRLTASRIYPHPIPGSACGVYRYRTASFADEVASK